MAKKISLSLEIGGVKQSISSINELETAIKDAGEQLKGIEIGSKEFQKLQGEIKKAKNFAEDLDESLKGQDLEKRVGAYAKVGSAIVGSFAAAQSAIALFGEESEDVARAAAKAQAVLTIALTAREVAEGAVALKTVASNVATLASAAAANAATVATRTLYATIAANPYGALLVAIGAVIGALVAFSDESKKQIDVLKEVKASVSEEAIQFGRQIVLLQSLNTANALRTKTIEDLNKAYPGFNAFLDKENQLTQDGIRFSELRLQQLQEEAKIKLLVSKIAEQSVKILELEQENIVENIGIWDELWAAIRGVGRIAPISALQEAIQEKNKRVDEARQQLKLLQGALDQTTKEYGKTLDAIGPYTKQLENQNKLNEKIKQTNEQNARTQQQVSEAYKKGLTATIDLGKAVDDLNASLKTYETTISKLGDIQYEAPILEQLKKVKEARKAAAQELVKDVKLVQQTLTTFETPTIGDNLISTFKVVRGALEEEFAKLGTPDFAGFTEIYKIFVAENESLSQEQKNILADLVQGYKDLSNFLTDPKFGFQDFISGLKNIGVEWDNFRAKTKGTFDPKKDPVYSGAEGLLQLIREITAANKTFTVEFKKFESLTEEINASISEGLAKVVEIQFDPIAAKQNADKYLKQLEKSLFQPLAIRLLQEELKAQQAALNITTDVVKRGEIEGLIKNITNQIKIVGETGKFAAALSQTTGAQVEKQAAAIVAQFVNLSNAVAGAENKLFSITKQINELKGTPQELSQAIGGTILSNIGVITDAIFVADKKQKEQRDKFRKDFENSEIEQQRFRDTLRKQGIDTTKADYADLTEAYIAFKMKEVDVTKTAEQEKAEAISKTFELVGQGIQLFSQTLNQVASLSNASIQNQLDFLQKSYEEQLTMVVGETESANKKREELQTEYETQRKQIEKQGTLNSLRFSLVQAVANSAQAITNVWANPANIINPAFGAIQTALISGLLAAEIAIINEQINMTQMFRKGGLLKAQGGMLLSGPTHEQGGIPLAQMGVIAEGQEAIINRNSLINYRDLLSTVNQAGGGRPLVVNSFDDTRIVEAIAEQKQKPLRAYVLQSEITNEQALSKRLDDLSKI